MLQNNLYAGSNGTGINFKPVSSLNELRNNVININNVYTFLANGNNSVLYKWDSQSSLNDDNNEVIKVNNINPGRWLKVGVINDQSNLATKADLQALTNYALKTDLNQYASILGVQNTSYNSLNTIAGGTPDVITINLTPAVTVLIDGLTIYVKASGANTVVTPTIQVNSLTAKVIVKGINKPLAVGDTLGSGYIMVLRYNATIDKFVLLNPAKGLNSFTMVNVNNGFNIADNGLITQWATGITDPVNSHEPAQTITLPIAFPNAIFTAIVSMNIGIASTIVDSWYQVYNTTLATVSLQRQAVNNSAGGVTTTPKIYAIGY